MDFDYNTSLTTVLAASALEQAQAPDTGHAHPNTNCLDCGQPLHGRFCAQCGQPADTHRITLRHLLLHDLPHSVWHVDKGLLYTLRHMLTRPGTTLREYLTGRRARHFRPITYLLLLLGLSALVMSAIGFKPPVDTRSAALKFMPLVMERYMKLYYKAPALIYAVLIPLNAGWATWLARHAKLNYAEHLLAQAFITGTLTFVSVFTTLPLLVAIRNPSGAGLISILGLLPSIGYTTWAYAQLLDQTKLDAVGRWLRGLGIAALQTLTILLASMGMMIYLTVVVLRENPQMLKDLKASQRTAKAAVATPPARP